jgi:predicted Zn-dependent protease
VARAAENEAGATPGARDTDRTAFLAAIDGMIYGENPAQGFVRGNRFEHPQLRIAFDAPEGFKLQNSPSAVLGTDGRGRYLLFDLAPAGAGGDLRGYLQSGWVPNQRLQDVQSLSVNGLDAAVGFGQVALNNQPAQAMFSAVRAADGKVYRLLYVRTGNLTRTDVAAFEESLRSFRGLTASEAAALRPLRIEIVPVGPGDTAASLARRMEVDGDAQALFELLNGLDRGRTLEPGTKVKVIRRG